MKDLLCCVCAHYNPDRLRYLHELLENLRTYKLTCSVIIDTNVASLPDLPAGDVTVCAHVSLEHPFHLTQMHRRHMQQHIDDYRWMLYVEDDVLIPWENFANYVRNWEILWPLGYVPGFLRVEEYNGELYAVDVTQKQALQPTLPNFVALSQPYHACWAMPAKAIKETMGPGFARLSDNREAAASYPMIDLGKTALVQVDGGHVTQHSYCYHISNSYAPCPTTQHGKIKVSEIFA